MDSDLTSIIRDRNSCCSVKTLAGGMGILGIGGAAVSACILTTAGASLFPILGLIAGIALVAFSLYFFLRARQREHEWARNEGAPQPCLERKILPSAALHEEFRPILEGDLGEKLPVEELVVEKISGKGESWRSVHTELLTKVHQKKKTKKQKPVIPPPKPPTWQQAAACVATVFFDFVVASPLQNISSFLQ